jgi:peptide/nickel transport system substrate-binding protein
MVTTDRCFLLQNYGNPYTTQKAKALLQEAGYGPGHPLAFTFLSPTIEPAFTNVPTLLKEQLACLGVQMKIEMLDKVAWMDRFIRKHDFEVTMGNVMAVALGNLALILEMTAPLNLARHSDTRVDALFQQWRTTTEPTAHAQATEQLQGYLADQLYLAGFANTPFFHAVRDYVKGYTFVDKLQLTFETAWLAQ